MTALLTIIIVLFVAVALWQMVKIFDLAQVGYFYDNHFHSTDSYTVCFTLFCF